MMISNRLTLDDLRNMSAGDIAELTAEELALLQDEAAVELASAKAVRELLDRALQNKYGERARAARQLEGKDTGTVRFDDGTVTVVADLPKKVDWDQYELAKLVERIRENGEDPADYVEITFKVPERRFTAWPAAIQDAFRPARTFRTGKEAFQLVMSEREGGR